MANKDNKCKDIKISDRQVLSDMLQDIYHHQKYMQEKVYGYDYPNMNLAELKDYLMMNNHALVDELHEMLDAVGGIEDGIGSAIWKPWKSDHPQAKIMDLSHLSEGDRKELLFEVADVLCFFMNIPIALGIEPKELYNVYMAKAQENKDRQDNGY